MTVSTCFGSFYTFDTTHTNSIYLAFLFLLSFLAKPMATYFFVGEKKEKLSKRGLSHRLRFFVSFFVFFSSTTHLLVLREEVRDLAGVEHVVEVLEHGLHHDLGVGEEEGHVLALHPCFDL